MASNTYGAIKLSTAEDVGAVLKKKTGSQDGYKPKEWADTINLMGLLPVRTASGSIAHFTDGADDVPLKSLTAQIVPIQEGTGDPSPSNVRPISGTSVLNVTQRGKNLLDNDGYFPLTRSQTSAYYRELSFTNGFLPKVELKEGITYTLSLDIQCNNEPFVFTVGAGDGRYLTDIASVGNQTSGRIHLTFTPTSANLASGAIMAIRCPRYGTPQDFEFTLSGVQLEIASTTTTYEAYKSETYTTALGRTVYGGTLDLVSGLLTLSRLKNVIDDTNENWTEYAREGGVVIYRKGNAVASIKDQLNQIANLFVFNENAHKIALQTPNTFVQGTSRHLFVQVAQSDFPTLSSFLTFLGNNNLEYIYDITPVEVQLTPEEVRTFLGANNFFNDCGGDTKVEYRADIGLLLASLQGNRGLQMMRATPTEETEEQEATENEDNEGKRQY